MTSLTNPEIFTKKYGLPFDASSKGRLINKNIKTKIVTAYKLKQEKK